MMAENVDEANSHESTFEIINPQHEGNHPPAENAPAPPGISNLPPPTALPAFAAFGGSATPPVPTGPPSFPPSFGPPATSPPKPSESAAIGGNPFSIRATSTFSHHHQAPPAPVQMPMPPLMEGAPAAVDFSGGQPQSLGAGGIEIPFDILSQGSTLTAGSAEAQQQGSGVWGWVRGAVHSSPLLSKVAETAKSSVDSVIATLDPQMKEYMNNRGILDVVITLDRDEEIRGIKEGVTRVFPASNVRPFVVAAGLHSAVQPLGFINGIQAAKQKITYIRSSGYVEPSSLVIGNEGFIFESSPEVWLYSDCLILDDSSRQLQVQSFTQPVQVPTEIIQVLKGQTNSDYPFKEIGFAVSVSHAMAHFWSLAPLEWQERLTGIPRAELLRNAALALVYSYRSKL